VESADQTPQYWLPHHPTNANPPLRYWAAGARRGVKGIWIDRRKWPYFALASENNAYGNQIRSSGGDENQFEAEREKLAGKDIFIVG